MSDSILDNQTPQPEVDSEFAEPHRVAASGSEAEVRAESARRTRRSFLAGGVAAAAGYGLYRAADLGPVIGRQPITFRRTFQADAKIMRALFGERGLSPTYPLSRAENLRLNGTIGMDQTLELASWRLQVAGVANAQAHPRFAADVTDWDYNYGDDMDTTDDANVKGAPGNGPQTKTGANKPANAGQAKAGAAPDAQKSQGADKAASQPKRDLQEPGAGAGSGQPATSSGQPVSPASSHNLDSKSVPMVNGLPHLTLAERFDRMAQQVTGKRNIGGDEAGASASSLNIGTPGLQLTLDDLRARLPFVEHVTQFRCIEGWSQIVHWGGFRMADFLEAFPPEKINGRTPRFVYMETPDGNYYGGYNMNAMRHPQTLLVTHIGGQPLTQAHGAPLRLFTPIKYGYKNIKRIGIIAYTDTKPDDYWTKLGYDWYAGL